MKYQPENLEEYVFTFGCNQQHQGCFHVIKAESSDEARSEMFRRFGGKWSMQYNSREEAGVYEYNLKELK